MLPCSADTKFILLYTSRRSASPGVVPHDPLFQQVVPGRPGRIQRRGHACFFGFFAPTSWLFVIVMMGGGMLLRHSALVNYAWGRASLSTLYIAVGTALAIADRIFWIAALRLQPTPGETSGVE